ncbi:MAG: insulinase family protein [Candidatus Latescibacteria bacterium]|nr:insulinase family protein [Candidatus Latescibacterota bacterium]
MKRLMLLLVLCGLTLANCRSTQPALQPQAEPSGIIPLLEQQIPIDSNIAMGTLDNGLRYYIRANQKPENRALLRLVIDVGSILEEEDQQGLAHFAEHMAFNGTRHFAKQELVEYLESVGMRFGADLNASTSFDQTIYMLEVPTDSLEVVEKAFQILEDWAHGIAFEAEEIEKERGVVIEEWRSGQGAGQRLWDQQAPILLKESLYARRMPIGQKSVLDTFQHQRLIDFYQKWYRPDLMAVIAVGDFEPQKIEALVGEYMGRIPAPAQALERPVPPVPDHEETLFAIASDPEATRSSIAVYYKQDVRPAQTVGAYRRQLVEGLFRRMLNGRLYELTIDPRPPFLHGYTAQGRLVRSKEVYQLNAGVVDTGFVRGLEAVLTEARRVQLHGFTATELEREKKEMLRGMEQIYRERDKTESSAYAGEYTRAFLVDEVIPGIEYEYGLYQTFVPQIELAEVNQVARAWFGAENRVVMVDGPEKEGGAIPTEKALAAVFDEVEKATVDPYVDRVADVPLVAQVPEPAVIVERSEIAELGVIQWRLANGIRVVLKPTDFKNDQILFKGISPGGHSLVVDQEYIAAATADVVVREGGVGDFDQIQLEKMLAGKVVSVSPWISGLSEGLSGSASPEDLEAMFQLIYLYITAPRADSTAFAAYKALILGSLENRAASPEAAFGDTLKVTLAQHHFRARPYSAALVEEMDLETSLRIYRDRFADTGDFTFFFVGNFDPEQMAPLVQSYLGGLPSAGRQERWADVGLKAPEGVVERSVFRGVEPKSLTRLVFTGAFDWDQHRERYLISTLAQVLRLKMRRVLREDLGGTYSVGVSGSYAHYPREEYTMSIAFGCEPERVEELTGVAFAQIDSLQRFGPDLEDIDNIKEMHRRRRQVQLKENGFWLGALESSYFHGLDPRRILQYEAVVDSLHADEIQAAAKRYFNRQRYVRVVLYPEDFTPPGGDETEQ